MAVGPSTTYACMSCGRRRRIEGISPTDAEAFIRTGCKRCGRITRHGHDLSGAGWLDRRRDR